MPPGGAQEELRKAIAAAAILCGQHDERKRIAIGKEEERSEHDRVQARLQKRLDGFYEAGVVTRPQEQASTSSASDTLEEVTGRASIQALQAIAEAYGRALEDDAAAAAATAAQSNAAAPDVPLLGARDAKTLRILLSIVGNWGLLPLVTRFDAAHAKLSGRRSTEASGSSRFVELPSDEEQRKQSQVASVQVSSALHSIDSTVSLFRTLLSSTPSKTHADIIASGIRTACASHLLAIGLRLGWCPASRALATRAQENGAALVRELLKSMSTPASMKALSAASQIASAAMAKLDGSQTPVFVKAVTERLYSAQLLRPDGVTSLLRVSFAGEDANERGLMRKLTSVGHLLSTPPPGMPNHVFLRATFPRLLEVVGHLPGQEEETSFVSLQSTNAQKDAACFALARQREIDPVTFDELMEEHVYGHIVPKIEKISADGQHSARLGKELLDAMLLLHGLAEHAEPSSQHLCAMLTPIAVALFSILAACSDATGKPLIDEVNGKGKEKKSDVVAAREVSRELLKTWLKLSDLADITELLSPKNKAGLFVLHGLPKGALIRGISDKSASLPGVRCTRDNISVVSASVDQTTALSEKLQQMTMQSIKLDDACPDVVREDAVASLMEAFDVSPSPRLLADLLKSSGNQTVASQLLVQLLEAYQTAKTLRKQEDDPTSGILYVQHIMQLCEAFGSGILTEQPDKVLTFIAFALQGSMTARNEAAGVLKGPEDADGIGTIRPLRKTDQKGGGLFDISRGQKEDLAHKGKSEDPDEEEDDESDDELKETALSLLLSLLEGNPNINATTHKLLIVIQAQVEAASHSTSDSIRALAREAALVLTARSLSDDGAIPTGDQSLLSEEEKALAKGRAQYQEALKLLQDPILPVRAHGLIMLKDLVASGHDMSKADVRLDDALVPAILDIFIKAVCDDESFLYLNAVKGLAEMGSTGNKSLVKRLVSLYVGHGSTAELTQIEVDERLRVGEALLQVVQKLEDALSAYAADIVDPLLTAVRDSALPTTLRSSMLSILGTCIEASPLSMAVQGYAAAIASGMLDLLSLEMRRLADTTQAQLDDALETSTKLPQLRRAALLLLILLVRGATHQLQEKREHTDDASLWPSETPRLESLRMPGGSTLSIPSRIASIDNDASSSKATLFDASLVPRVQNIVGYVQQYDADALVRHQAGELLQDLDNFRLESVHSGANVSLA